ncbi:E3 ubiquitin-protein ligase E3D-like [Gigantopelta aegis]|uniref:E3 ubiquitin-protein ligase E3D-like n=1 Tax=Gigantopelta aegis TaxID=1735272 RepID=UPI001B88E064|nr:E3 ubiquitin-protein ligase E3D-like [Gigantopelta aegis]
MAGIGSLSATCTNQFPSSEVVRLHAEYKPMLSVVNIYLDFSKSNIRNISTPGSNITVTTEKNVITVMKGGNSVQFEMNGLVLCPLSCRGLKLCGGHELQMTLQTTGVNDFLDTDSCFMSQVSGQNEMVEKIHLCQSRCFCSCCGQRLFKHHGIFERVLPLPSENWSDFADFWFCHCHGDTPKPRPTSVWPKKSDCLVSNTYILVSASHVADGAVQERKDNPVLQCARCGSFLGVTMSNQNKENDAAALSVPHKACQLYLHALSFTTESEESVFEQPRPPEVSLELFLSQLIQEQSRLYTSFRFIVNSTAVREHDRSLTVLIWLLDQDQLLYIAEGLLPSVPQKLKVQGQRAIKMLYRAVVHTSVTSNSTPPPGADLFETWQKDNTVHGVTLPHPLCLKLVTLLMNNTKKLPPYQRRLNGFNVTYLQKK